MLTINNLTSVLSLPSRIDQVETWWSRKAGINLWVKRDDLIHPKVSGNKFRKLEGWLDNYVGEDVRSISTFGGPYSNHLLAVAYAAHYLNIESVGFVRGDNLRYSNEVLEDCKNAGMKLEFLSYTDYNSYKNRSAFEDGSIFIPEGGAGQLGMVGCNRIMNEVEKEMDCVFVACGTGTTLAGMSMDRNEKFIGVQCLKGKDYIKLELREKFDCKEVKVLDEYHFGGFAKTTPELIEFISGFRQETGILLDPLYTGKMFYAMQEVVLKNKEFEGKSVMGLHTGGLTGWSGMKEEFLKV